MSASVISIQVLNREDHSTLVCRGCLTEWGEMKNMYEWGLDVDFFRYTDIMRVPSDGLPVWLCSDCEENLKNTKDFMERCQQSNRILKHNLRIDAIDNQNSNKGHVSTLLDKDKLVLCITAPDPENKINLPCPFDNCNASFIKRSLLGNHLKVIHNLSNAFIIELQYYCTFQGCVYNLNSSPNKFFSGRKFLNQHYNKIHRDKMYSCEKCKTKFSLKTDLYRHSQTCETVYDCSSCNAKYASHESYLVHLKRRHPNIHAKYKEDRKRAKHISDVDNCNSIELINNIDSKRKKNNASHAAIKETDEAKRNHKDIKNYRVFEDVSSSVKTNQKSEVNNITAIVPKIQPINAVNNVENFINKIDKDIGVVPVFEKLNQKLNSKHIQSIESHKNINVNLNNINIEKHNITEMVNIEAITTNFLDEYIVKDCEESIQEPKKSSATQFPESISYETLNSWTNKTDFEMQTDGISTQTVLDEILSLKPHNEDEPFFTESVSDIETQTFAFEFPLSRCNKETQFSTSLLPDSSFKETQTCVCFCHLSKPNCRHFGSVSNQNCYGMMSTETQTGDSRRLINSDVMLSFSSTETQTCFNNSNDSI